MENSRKWRYPVMVGCRITSTDKSKMDRLAAEKNLTHAEILRNSLKQVLDNGSKEEKAR